MGTQQGSAGEVVTSRSGSGNIQSGDSAETRLYLVKWSDTTWTTLDIRNATGVPVYGAALGSSKLYVIEKSVQPHPSDQTIGMVTVQYKTLDPSKPMPNLNPTTSTWGVAKNIAGFPVEIPIQKDLNNKICVNVVNEPFNPPITTVIYDQQINITFLTTASSHQYNIALALGMVNSASVTLGIGPISWVIPAGELRFLNYQVQEQYDQDGNRTSMFTENFLWRIGGWVESRPNFSLLHRNLSVEGGTTNKSIERNMISTGTTSHETTEPWYLDTAGQQITASGIVVNNTFSIYQTASFAALLSEIAL